MNEEIKELLFLLHNDRLTEVGKRKLEQEIERLNKEIKRIELDDSLYIAQKDDEIRELKEENLSLKLENQILKSGVESERKYSYGYR